MADNVIADPGTGGATFASDDIGGVQYPRSKLSLGADGTAVDAGAGAGVVGTDTQRVTLGSDDPAVTALQIMDDWDETNRAAVNTIAGQVGVQGASGTVTALTQRVVLATDVALPTGTNALGSVIPQPTTSGGLTIARDIDLDNGTLTVVKASAGQLYGMTIGNLGTVAVFVKFYDATSGTLGTGTPVLTITVPGNATDDTVFTTSFGGMGLAFATGICVGAGTGVADADNTDPGANIVIANIYYK